MTWDLLIVALMAGAANWAFRVLPTLAGSDRLPKGGLLERFLSATGPAAIATLFVAAILPSLSTDLAALLPVITGTVAVLGLYLARPSVALATIGGAVAHGVTVWLLT